VPHDVRRHELGVEAGALHGDSERAVHPGAVTGLAALVAHLPKLSPVGGAFQGNAFATDDSFCSAKRNDLFRTRHSRAIGALKALLNHRESIDRESRKGAGETSNEIV
jgi:hypothetical protein